MLPPIKLMSENTKSQNNADFTPTLQILSSVAPFQPIDVRVIREVAILPKGLGQKVFSCLPVFLSSCLQMTEQPVKIPHILQSISIIADFCSFSSHFFLSFPSYFFFNYYSLLFCSLARNEERKFGCLQRICISQIFIRRPCSFLPWRLW